MDEPAKGGDIAYVRQRGCLEISDDDTQGDNRGPVADTEDGDRQKITVREEGVWSFLGCHCQRQQWREGSTWRNRVLLE